MAYENDQRLGSASYNSHPCCHRIVITISTSIRALERDHGKEPTRRLRKLIENSQDEQGDRQGVDFRVEY